MAGRGRIAARGGSECSWHRPGRHPLGMGGRCGADRGRPLCDRLKVRPTPSGDRGQPPLPAARQGGRLPQRAVSGLDHARSPRRGHCGEQRTRRVHRARIPCDTACRAEQGDSECGGRYAENAQGRARLDVARDHRSVGRFDAPARRLRRGGPRVGRGADARRPSTGRPGQPAPDSTAAR